MHSPSRLRGRRCGWKRSSWSRCSASDSRSPDNGCAQSHSVALSRNRTQSIAISRNCTQSIAISRNRTQSIAISRNRTQSIAISDRFGAHLNQSQSVTDSGLTSRMGPLSSPSRWISSMMTSPTCRSRDAIRAPQRHSADSSRAGSRQDEIARCNQSSSEAFSRLEQGGISTGRDFVQPRRSS